MNKLYLIILILMTGNVFAADLDCSLLWKNTLKEHQTVRRVNLMDFWLAADQCESSEIYYPVLAALYIDDKEFEEARKTITLYKSRFPLKHHVFDHLKLDVEYGELINKNRVDWKIHIELAKKYRMLWEKYRVHTAYVQYVNMIMKMSFSGVHDISDKSVADMVDTLKAINMEGYDLYNLNMALAITFTHQKKYLQAVKNISAAYDKHVRVFKNNHFFTKLSAFVYRKVGNDDAVKYLEGLHFKRQSS